jgi:hypothetical protein
VEAYQDNYLLTIENSGQIPMPVELLVIYTDATTENVSLPVEIWQRGNSWSHLFKTDKTIQRVVLDPNKLLADINILNDSWNKP